MRESGQAGDLPARELDRAVAGEFNIAAQDSRRAEPRAAGHVEERLVGAGAGRDGSGPYYRATPPSPCPTPRAWRCRCDERAAVGQRPRQGQARSAVAAAGVETDVSVIGERAGRRHRGPVMEREQSPGADRSEPRQSAVRPQRRAVLDEGVASDQAQMRVSGQAGDLTARELDRAVAGQSNSSRSRLPPCRSPRCRDVEERLVGAGAGQIDPCPYYRATPPSPRPAPRAWRCRCARSPLLVSVPPMLRIVPPSPPLASTRR